MKKFMTTLIICASIVMLAAAAEYVCGRIILPEMGLHAPSYTTWVWFTVVSVIAYAIISVMAVWIRALDD